MELFRVVGLVGVFLGVVALSVPWMELTGFLGLRTTVYGFATDGVLSFIFILMAMGILFTRPRKWKVIPVILLSLIALAITTAAVMNVSQIVNKEALIIVSWGPGIGLMVISCVMMDVAAILFARVKNFLHD